MEISRSDWRIKTDNRDLGTRILFIWIVCCTALIGYLGGPKYSETLIELIELP